MNLHEGWKWEELKDLCHRMHQGINTVTDKIEYQNEGHYIIQSKHITNGYLDFSDARFIKDEDYEYYKEKFNPKKNDILFCNIGTIGKSLVVDKDEDFLIAWNLFLLKLKNDLINARYLKYYLDKLQSIGYYNRFLTGGTVKFINKTKLGSIKIPLPPLEQQKEIITTLNKGEQLKQWRKESDKLTDDYPNSVFLEMFGDQRKNEKEFEIKGFLDVFNVKTGKLDSNAAVENGKYPFFTCSRDTLQIDNYSFDCEALLLAGNNAAGKYSVKYYEGKFDAYQRTYVLTLKNNSGRYRFFHFLLGKKLNELQSKSIGTNTKYLTMGILKHIKMICPPTELQNKFAGIVKQVEKMKSHQNSSKQQIDDLFNVFIQKAFRGELNC